MLSKPILQLVLGVVLVINGVLMGWPLIDARPATTITLGETVMTGLLVGLGGLFLAMGLQGRSKRG
ncbi:MAG: hypothetical protein ACOYKM_09845 [Caulobacterales bacterium]|jgi:hypothetical protein